MTKHLTDDFFLGGGGEDRGGDGRGGQLSPIPPRFLP